MVNLHEAARCRKDGIYTPVYKIGGANHNLKFVLKGLTWFTMMGEYINRISICVYYDNDIIELI